MSEHNHSFPANCPIRFLSIFPGPFGAQPRRRLIRRRAYRPPPDRDAVPYQDHIGRLRPTPDSCTSFYISSALGAHTAPGGCGSNSGCSSPCCGRTGALMSRSSWPAWPGHSGGRWVFPEKCLVTWVHRCRYIGPIGSWPPAVPTATGSQRAAGRPCSVASRRAIFGRSFGFGGGSHQRLGLEEEDAIVAGWPVVVKWRCVRWGRHSCLPRVPPFPGRQECLPTADCLPDGLPIIQGRRVG